MTRAGLTLAEAETAAVSNFHAIISFVTDFTRHETTMGYPFQITVHSEYSLHSIQPVIRLACHTIDALEAIFNFENNDSIINKYNRGELRLDETPKLFQEVMMECLTWQKITGGIFTPFNQSLLATNHAGNIFDPRGILKSYSMKLLSEMLTAFNLPDHRIQVWDDIYISDTHDKQENWTVNFTQPLTLTESKQNILKLNFKNTHMRAISKSNIQDNQGSIWIKNMCQPIVADFSETTIIANSPIASDVWSLVCLAEGEKALTRIENYNKQMIEQNTPENTIEGLMVTGDYQYVYTSGFKQYIETV